MPMKNVARVSGLLLVGSVLAGCAGQDMLTVNSVPEDYRTNHPIVISEREHTLDVPVASGARELNVATSSNITAFASAFGRSGTGVLHMLVPSGSANEHAVDRVRKDVFKALKRGGVSEHDVSVQRYDATQHDPSAPIRLAFSGVTADVPHQCGQWPGNIGQTPRNRHHADFGCSSQKNLAAQIANPGDLLGPRASSPIDAIQRGAVIGTYQKGPTGKASEVNF